MVGDFRPAEKIEVYIPRNPPLCPSARSCTRIRRLSSLREPRFLLARSSFLKSDLIVFDVEVIVTPISLVSARRPTRAVMKL
jgi:hypothetical protein